MTSLALATLAARFRRADISFFYTFAPAPYGGASQFLRALWQEFARRGWRLENNTISRATRACLYNSFNFDYRRLRRFRRAGCRMVHRVDGPIGVYRGWDDGADRRIWEMNQELADATIFQSTYSLRKHLALGLEFKSAGVILNTTDPAIFHPNGRVRFDRGRKTRLISMSWSDNPNKGAATCKWLEDRLDWDRFEYTFVGRTPVRFDRVRLIPPLASGELAALLREHDIFVTASRHESCSNALLEALGCGLPAVYLDSGGSAEIVGEAGFGFTREEELPALLDRLVAEYEDRQRRIAIPALGDVADGYLAVLGL